MIFDNRVVTWCDCGSHAVSVEREMFNGVVETFVQFWTAGVLKNSRLRMAWAALRGELYHDGVCLRDEDVARVIAALQAKPKEAPDAER